MNEINICYFSGTGNCQRAGEIIANFAEANGYRAKIESISKIKDFEPADLNVFLFPTYSFTVPQIMKKFLKNLSKSDGKKAAVIATFGAQGPNKVGNEGRSLYLARKILTRKKFDVFFCDAAAYPSNLTQVVNTLPEKQITAVYEKSDKLVEKMAQKILAGDIYHKPCGKLKSLLVSLFDWSFTCFGRRFFGKLFVADDKCNDCGVCVKECPSDVIKIIRGKPFWNYNCQACQRCINICPRKAIQTSFVRLVVFSALFLAFCFAVLVDFAKLDLTMFLVHLFSYASVFVILDFTVRQLEKIKFLYPVFTLNHTKNFRRYIARSYKY